MIVEQAHGVTSAFRACIDGALASGCRAYFGSPSPLHALLLNEGARRFPELHGTFTQSANAVEALSMAQGVAHSGSIPLVSAGYPDFLALQEVLQTCLEQSLACVIAVFLYQRPASPGASPLAFNYPCFLNPWPAGGLPIMNLMPANLDRLYSLTQEAFVLARQLQQPIALLLDPILMTQTQELPPPLEANPISLSPVGPRLEDRIQALEALTQYQDRWQQSWSRSEDIDHYLIATGALGGWLLEAEWENTHVIVPESLFPLALPERFDKPAYVLEFAPGHLHRQIQRLRPQAHLQQIALPWQRHYPVGLAADLNQRLAGIEDA